MNHGVVLDAVCDIVDQELNENLVDFVMSVDMSKSGSGIEYLGHNDFGIYDYPLAEDWLKAECTHRYSCYRLGDGTFHYVSFFETDGAVEFKLRWGRETVKRDGARKDSLHD